MDVKTAMMELAEAVKRILNDRISKYGFNPNVGKNTLEGSNLQKSIQVTATEDGIALQIADYWEYVARGRKKKGNKSNKKRLSVKNINDWVRKKELRVGKLKQSQIVWAFVKNLERPFMIYDNDGDLTKMIPELNVYIDEWFKHLYDAIMAELDNYFND